MSHPFLSSFDGSGTPQGAFTSSTRGGLAIDQTTGHIVITEANLSELTFPDPPLRFGLNIYDSTGTFVLQIDEGDLPSSVRAALDLSEGAPAVAIDSSGGASSGDIYVVLGNLVLVFDSAGNYVRKLDGSNTPDGSFVLPKGLAVDSEGNVYVADTGTTNSETLYHHVIDKFNSEGNYVSQISGSHVDGHTGHLAIDSAGNLYAIKAGTGVAKFDSAGAFQYLLGTDRASTVAVDPATDDLYVAEGPYVAQYDSAGNLLGRFGSSEIGASIGGLGVKGSSGNVYVIDQQGFKIPFHVDVFGPTESATTPDVVSIEPTDEISYFDATFHGTVNPQGVPTSYRFEYRRAGQNFEAWRSTPGQTTGSGTEDVKVSATVGDLQKEDSGTADGKSYEVRLVATNTDADASTFSAGVDTFKTLAVPLPSPVVDQPTTFTATTVHVTGTIGNPSPGFETTYRFISTGRYGPLRSIGSAPGEIFVEEDVEGLAPNSEYVVYLEATNPRGTVTSSPQSFTTAAAPPSQVETIPPGLVEETSARLGGWVNPNNSPTSYWFEYGLDDCASTPCASIPVAEDASAGSGSDSTVVTEDLGGLDPSTTYHYRVVAKNSAGTVIGNDIVFTTDDPNTPGPPVRGFELVNSPDKGNQPLVSASLLENGTEALWGVGTGVGDSPSGVSSLFKSHRTPTGWQSESTLPPLEELLGEGVSAYEPQQVSPDGTRFLFMVTTFFAGVPEYALVDLTSHTQQSLGSLGSPPGSGQDPEMFADRTVEQVYASTRLPLAKDDEDDQFDIYAYETATESWLLASLRPDGSDPACAVSGAARVGSARLDYPDTSDGGSGEKRLFFVTTPSDDCSEPAELFVRDLVAGSTAAVSLDGLIGEAKGASFIRANPDGSAALFKTASTLAPEDGNEGMDLYVWRSGVGNECVTCIVPDAKVEQAMASPDLSYVYFSSTARLVAGRGLSVEGDEKSFYVVHEGHLDYISSADSNLQLGDGGSYGQTNSDGSVALFRTSSRGVTADGRQTAVYRYDTDRTELQCVSCANDGSVGGLRQLGINAPTGALPSAMDNSGDEIVFSTDAPLFPFDVNRAADIYEWRNGKSSLITDGVTEFPESSGRLALGGISGDGANVLFTVSDQLTGYELDHLSNVYIARAGGGFPPPPEPPAPCQEDSCQGPLVAPPTSDDIGSASFAGPGNSSTTPARKSCRRGQRKVRRQGRVRCASKRHKRAGKRTGQGKRHQGRRR